MFTWNARFSKDTWKTLEKKNLKQKKRKRREHRSGQKTQN